jgi:hypothetical protein
MEKIDNSKNTSLLVAYEDPKKKITFYCLKDPTQLPAMRGIAAMKAKRMGEMKVTGEILEEIDKKIRFAINSKQDFVEAFAWWQELMFRVRLVTEESCILELVKLYYYLPDEDPEIPTEEFNKKKGEIFEQNPEIKAFFLRIGIAMMENYGMKHAEEVLSYLEETRKISERIEVRLRH